jgi:hypothetical protein
MLIINLLFVILQITSNVTIAIQVGNFILFILNSIYTILIIPTYREHKLNTKYREEMTSSKAKILEDRDEEIIRQYGSDIEGIKKSIHNIDLALQRLESKVK